MIVTDEQLLRRVSVPVRTVAEGGEIARKLTAALARHNKHAEKKRRRTLGKVSLPVGVGLAAPQLGILKRVVVIQTGKVPLVLMNPEVVAASETKVPYAEGCLSFPGVQVETERHVWVKVKTMNHPEVMTFGPTTPEEWGNPTLLLKSVVVQHELDHLDGVLFAGRPVPAPSTNIPEAA